MKKSWKECARKTWHFIWHEDSLLSWFVNIVLAFVIIKFLIYPGLGFLFGTGFPVVAVVSSSMEHHPSDFAEWWKQREAFYKGRITQETFATFPFEDGFNKGDIMVVVGVKPKEVTPGMILVFWSQRVDPIIHRVVGVRKDVKGYVFETKGDNNMGQIQTAWLDETNVREQQIIGRAVLRIPFLGWVKIWFVSILHWFGLVQYSI